MLHHDTFPSLISGPYGQWRESGKLLYISKITLNKLLLERKWERKEEFRGRGTEKIERGAGRGSRRGKSSSHFWFPTELRSHAFPWKWSVGFKLFFFFLYPQSKQHDVWFGVFPKWFVCDREANQHRLRFEWEGRGAIELTCFCLFVFWLLLMT